LIGHYNKYFKQQQKMGTGGFATVWRATDLLDGVDYAVKVLIAPQSLSLSFPFG